MTIVLIVFFFLLGNSLDSISLMPSTHPYRTGSAVITPTTLSTFRIIFSNAHSGEIALLPVALGVSGLQYNNIDSNQLLFNMNPIYLDPSDLTGFWVKIEVDDPAHFSKFRFRYFSCIANDYIVMTMYQTTQKQQQITYDVTNGITMQQQNIIPPHSSSYTCDPLDIPCNIKKQSTQFIENLSSGFGIGKAIYGQDTQSYTYSIIKTTVFLNQLGFTYTGPWKFQADSDSTNLADLKIKVTYSSFLSGVLSNCSIILYNTSYTHHFGFYFTNSRLTIQNNRSYYSIRQKQDQSSAFFMMGGYSFQVNNQSRLSFEVSNNLQSYITFYSTSTYVKQKFNVFGTTMQGSCTDIAYLFTSYRQQKCYSSCPGRTYSNSSKYCLACQYPCFDCISPYQCLSCQPSTYKVPKNYICQYCEHGTYYSNMFCQPCPTGCLTCINQTFCTSCNYTMKMVMVSNLCVTCQTGTYYDHYFNLCKQCPPQCITCQNRYHCTSCNSTMKYYLDWTCLPCNLPGRYYDSIQKTCQYCSYGCVLCQEQNICQSCSQTLKLILENDQCVSCISGTYFNISECQPCPYPCSTCDSSNFCTSCIADPDIVLAHGRCGNCSIPFFSVYCPPQRVICSHSSMIITAAKYCQFLYQFQITQTQQGTNSFNICMTINSTTLQNGIQKIYSHYNIKSFLDDQELQTSNYQLHQESDQICFIMLFTKSFTNQNVTIILINNTNTNAIINTIKNITLTGAFLSSSQKSAITFFGSIVDGIASNSGAGFSSLAATSTISLFMGFIQFIQITSLYMFTQAPIPHNLKTLFDNLMSAQSLSLLPFSIPNPLESNPIIIQGDKIYEQQQMDLHFFRGSITSIFETIIWISLYLVLYFIFTHLKKIDNKGYKFFYLRIVNRLFSNCAVCIQAIQIFIVFSGAATLTSTYFNNTATLLNYFSGLVFMFLFLVFPLMSVFFIIKYKPVNQIDTDDIYPAIQRDRKGAEIYTLIRLLGLFSAAITIPLLHYLYVICIVSSLIIIQLYILIKKNLFKYRVMRWLRIIHTSLFLLFNLLYIVFYILDTYHPDANIVISLRFGTVALVCLIGIYIIDILQAIIDLGDIFYQNIKYLFFKKKKKVKNIQQNFQPPEQSKNQLNISQSVSIKQVEDNPQVKQKVVFLPEDDSISSNKIKPNHRKSNTTHHIPNKQQHRTHFRNKINRRLNISTSRNLQSQKKQQIVFIMKTNSKNIDINKQNFTTQKSLTKNKNKVYQQIQTLSRIQQKDLQNK